MSGYFMALLLMSMECQVVQVSIPDDSAFSGLDAFLGLGESGKISYYENVDTYLTVNGYEVQNTVARVTMSEREGVFGPDRIELLSAIGHRHFWFVGRQKLVVRLLRDAIRTAPSRILDLGCGTGMMLKTLVEEGHDAVGIDLRPEGLLALRGAMPHAQLILSSAENIPCQEGVFDIVLMLDVLEHVDDQAALQETYRVLRPGGAAIIMVPVYPWLWSQRDVAAAHRRRYRRPELLALLAQNHFETVKVRFYQCTLFPLVLVSRLLGKAFARQNEREERIRPVLNRLFSRINTAEVRLGDYVPLPWGSSIVVVCRRPVNV